MYRKNILLAWTFTLLLLVPSVPSVSSVSAGAQIQQVTAPYTYTVATIDQARTLDPHWAYDTASERMISNVYETLIDFKEESSDEFILELATNWTITTDGKTYTFEMRGTSGVHRLENISAYDGVGSPRRSTWHDVTPSSRWYSTNWTLTGWTDTDLSKDLTVSDQIALERSYSYPTGQVVDVTQHFHVDAVSPDGTVPYNITVTEKPPPNFTDGSTLTTADIEYSFERGMVRDPSGGPMWMLYEPLLGVFNSRSYGDLSIPAVAAELGQKIDAAIESNATHVWFNLTTPYPPFIQILSQSWASILNKAHMLSIDDFPGFDVTGYDGWVIYNDYQYEVGKYGFKVSPLDHPDPNMMGTGPFTFTEWVKGEGGYTRLDRNIGYWGGWGARAVPPSRGYINTYIEFQVSEWSSRKAGFIAGTYDSVYVPRANMAEVWQQPGIECRYPNWELALDVIFFNFNVADGISGLSPYVGTETFDADNDGVPDGIPLNFFADRNVRKAFAYLFNGTKFITEQFLGEAIQPATPIIPGLAPIPTDEALAWHIANRPSIDLARAAAHLQQAWGGEVWSKGFKFTYVYNTGNEPRRIIGEMLRDTLKLIEPIPEHFVMDVVGVDWSIFFDELWYAPAGYRSIMPMLSGGWQGDFADAHDFVTAFMASYGYYGYPTSYSNATVDALIKWGIAESDPEARIAIYDQLNQLYLDDTPGIPIAQALGRHWQRDWVQGWSYNPLSTGSAAAGIGDVDGLNLYTMWKEDLPQKDVNDDGKVNIADLTKAAKAYGSYFIADLPPYPTGPLGTFASNWDSSADINQDMKVNIADLTKMALLFGYKAPPWNKLPVASFTESAETVYTGEFITFNASESYDPDGAIIFYFWDFGDGTNAAGTVVSHAYADDGNYAVTLIVTDDYGDTEKAIATKYILNRSPVASFTESAETVYTGEAITFNATNSYDLDGTIVSYFWDFGDGTNTTGIEVQHAYADNGTYTATLIVTDDDGATNTASSMKTVLNRPPVAIFTESATTVLTGEVITFNASSSYDPDGSIASYLWDFGDGTNTTGVIVDHAYEDDGTYTVTLTVTDDDGATATASSTKTVLTPPP